MPSVTVDAAYALLQGAGPGQCVNCAMSLLTSTRIVTFIRFGAIDVTKPYKFIGVGAIDVTKPSKFIGRLEGNQGRQTRTTRTMVLAFGPRAPS